jgi:hypothetical protein
MNIWGYASGVTGFVKREHASALSSLVAKIALPALLFRAMANLDLVRFDLKIFLVIAFAKLLGNTPPPVEFWSLMQILFVSNLFSYSKCSLSPHCSSSYLTVKSAFEWHVLVSMVFLHPKQMILRSVFPSYKVFILHLFAISFFLRYLNWPS